MAKEVYGSGSALALCRAFLKGSGSDTKNPTQIRHMFFSLNPDQSCNKFRVRIRPKHLAPASPQHSGLSIADPDTKKTNPDTTYFYSLNPDAPGSATALWLASDPSIRCPYSSSQ